MPHLDAAYNLARWLLRNDRDAEDVAQEACLRAFKFFEGFRGDDTKAKIWLLTIVRNACYRWLQNRRVEAGHTSFDDELHSAEQNECSASAPLDPEAALLLAAERERVQECLLELPLDYRAVVILREMEDLSYREIATVMELPIGTVMSRLARGRALLQQILIRRLRIEG